MSSTVGYRGQFIVPFTQQLPTAAGGCPTTDMSTRDGASPHFNNAEIRPHTEETKDMKQEI